jgi:alpha-galactosidase
MALATVMGYDIRRNDIDYALLRKLVAQWRDVVDLYWADFYPLTSWSIEPDLWMAWQLDRPEEGKGMVQAFRRPSSAYESARLKLRGLDRGAEYRVRSIDGGPEMRVAGSELLEKGLLVSIPERPGAVVFLYDRVR